MENSQIIVNWTQIIFISVSIFVSAMSSLGSIVWFISKLKIKVDTVKIKVDEIESELNSHKLLTASKIEKQDAERLKLKDLIVENQTNDNLFQKEVLTQLKSLQELTEKQQKAIDKFNENINKFYQVNKNIINPEL